MPALALTLPSGTVTLSFPVFAALLVILVLAVLFALLSNLRTHKQTRLANRSRQLADDMVRALNLFRNVKQEDVFELIRKGSYPDVDTLLSARARSAQDPSPPEDPSKPN